LIRRDFPELAGKYFYHKPYFWTGAYFVASCGGVTVSQLKQYVETVRPSPLRSQKSPQEYTKIRYYPFVEDSKSIL
jgi:putative transposase